MVEEQNVRFPVIHCKLLKFNVRVFQLINLQFKIPKYLHKVFFK